MLISVVVQGRCRSGVVWCQMRASTSVSLRMMKVLPSHTELTSTYVVSRVLTHSDEETGGGASPPPSASGSRPPNAI